MKKEMIGIMALIVVLIFPLCAPAAPIVAQMQIDWSDPTGKVTFPSSSQGNYYLDYGATVNWNGTSQYLEAFCVENQPAPTDRQFHDYTLYGINGSSEEKYLAAAYIAENYYNQSDAWKAAAQIAIWEVIFDYGDLNLLGGSFSSNNIYNTAAAGILNGLANANIFGDTSWALAVHADYQNYLVKNPAPVPEPATMLLLGTGLIGLAGLSRRKFKNK